MILFYNILQLLLAPLFILLFPLYLIGNKGKRKNILRRLGFGLKPPAKEDDHYPTIWIHALSVGEVTSAVPLVQALRSEIPRSNLVFSATTASGQKLAESLIGPWADSLVPFPLDIRFVVSRFMKQIKPDLFILVETDFWPNFLNGCACRGVQALLVNGRISSRSMRSYLRYDFFFKPMFNLFALLCMQTEQDTENMQQLGIPRDKLKTIGNLKFASPADCSRQALTAQVNTSPGRLTIIGGSTHDGEEKALISSYHNLRKKGYDLHMVIAPRQVGRSSAIAELARTAGLSVVLYSTSNKAETDITILDTIGDLGSIYASADITFIGGSLVPEGGHNPLEASRQGKPLLFGPFMEDFSEISSALLEIGAAFQVTDQPSLENMLEQLIISEELRHIYGNRARQFTEKQQDVLAAHIAAVRQCL